MRYNYTTPEIDFVFREEVITISNETPFVPFSIEGAEDATPLDS